MTPNQHWWCRQCHSRTWAKWQNIWLPWSTCPSWGLNKWWPAFFSALILCKPVSFSHLFSVINFFFFTLSCFLFVILLVKVFPNHSAEVQCGVLKLKKSAMCLVEKIQKLDLFRPSGHETRLCWSVDKTWPVWQESHPVRISPRSNGSLFATHCTWWLYDENTENHPWDSKLLSIKIPCPEASPRVLPFPPGPVSFFPIQEFENSNNFGQSHRNTGELFVISSVCSGSLILPGEEVTLVRNKFLVSKHSAGSLAADRLRQSFQG